MFKITASHAQNNNPACYIKLTNKHVIEHASQLFEHASQLFEHASQLF